MRLAAALVGIALATATGLLAREPAPLTKVTVRAMPPALLTRRLFGELGSIMLPAFYHGRPGRRPTRPLDMLDFATVPRAANVAGLCETQSVIVDFEPVGPPRGADTPVRPRRITSSTGFIVRDLARVRADPAADGDDEPDADAACRAIDPRNAHVISGRSEYEVQAGLRVVLALIEAGKGGRSLAPLDCSGAMVAGARPSDAQCLAAIGRLGIDDISWIESCESGTPGAQCHQVSAGEFEMRLVMEPNGSRLARARLETMIVTADERID